MTFKNLNLVDNLFCKQTFTKMKRIKLGKGCNVAFDNYSTKQCCETDLLHPFQFTLFLQGVLRMPVTPTMSSPHYNDCASEMSDCSSLEEGREGSSSRRGNTIITIRQDRKARRVESNNRERRRMHELNHAFQVG